MARPNRAVKGTIAKFHSTQIQFLIAWLAFYYLYGLIENPPLLFPVQCIVAVWGLSPPCHHVTLILTVIVPLMVTLPAPGACLLRGADSDFSVKFSRSYYACGFVLLRHAWWTFLFGFRISNSLAFFCNEVSIWNKKLSVSKHKCLNLYLL